MLRSKSKIGNKYVMSGSGHENKIDLMKCLRFYSEQLAIAENDCQSIRRKQTIALTIFILFSIVYFNFWSSINDVGMVHMHFLIIYFNIFWAVISAGFFTAASYILRLIRFNKKDDCKKRIAFYSSRIDQIKNYNNSSDKKKVEVKINCQHNRKYHE